MHTFRLIFSMLLIVIIANGCSVLGNEALPETKLAVVRVTAEYLGRVVAGQAREAEVMILWSNFVGNVEQTGITKSSFMEQIQTSQGKWSPEEHPLLNLEILDVEQSEDDATVRLRKKDRPDYPEIKLSLVWAGSGWLISSDSLFGRDALLLNFKVPPQHQH